MQRSTQRLWAAQDRHPDDRKRLFSAVAGAVEAQTVLYPGSFVDIAASFVFNDVTYVDVDQRAARFFADATGVNKLIEAHRTTAATWRFISADYSGALPIADESTDLLISLYAGFVSAACTRYLRLGGTLLVNPSHGDTAMASIDRRYRLDGVVVSRAGDYRVANQDLDRYLIPKRDGSVTAELLRKTGRGIAYTRSPYAYLFRRVG